MWDMMRADQLVTTLAGKDSSLNKKNESIKLYEKIFQLHHIDRDQFNKSFEYYSSSPQLFRPIIDSLAKKQTASLPTYVHPFKKDSLLKHKTDSAVQ